MTTSSSRDTISSATPDEACPFGQNSERPNVHTSHAMSRISGVARSSDSRQGNRVTNEISSIENESLFSLPLCRLSCLKGGNRGSSVSWICVFRFRTSVHTLCGERFKFMAVPPRAARVAHCVNLDLIKVNRRIVRSLHHCFVYRSLRR
jgi:hypothetical protein